jgi:hypothetical protein
VSCQYPLHRTLFPRSDARFSGGHASAIFNEPGSVTAGVRPDAVIVEPTDAIVRVVLACVCGSDLWYYRGESPFEPGPIGHEFVGVVEEVGADVRGIAKGDFVIAPFAYSDGSCPRRARGAAGAATPRASAGHA